jgi:hypothetical protein
VVRGIIGLIIGIGLARMAPLLRLVENEMSILDHDLTIIFQSYFKIRKNALLPPEVMSNTCNKN